MFDGVFHCVSLVVVVVVVVGVVAVGVGGTALVDVRDEYCSNSGCHGDEQTTPFRAVGAVLLLSI